MYGADEVCSIVSQAVMGIEDDEDEGDPSI